MTGTPIVSVLMTCYNREKYIGPAIESVLASTLGDFELIIVDDRSKDASFEQAKKYLADPRVQLHLNEQNLGDYPNRNRTASLARGKYLKYVDSDDMVFPHGLAVMVDSMEKFPDAALGLCKPDSKDGVYPLQISPREAWLEHFLGPGFFTNSPTSAIMRADAFREVGGFSGKRFVGDTELWLKLGTRRPVVKLASGLTWYRRHDDQELNYIYTNTAPVHDYYMVCVQAVMDSGELLRPDEKDRALRKLRDYHARTIFSLLRRRHAKVAWELYRRSGMSVAQLLRGLRRPE